jgi:ABC-type sulfate transport system substrate-binding protein
VPVDLAPYLREQALNPRWGEDGHVHDWRDYISQDVQKMWNTFTDEQKFALVAQADWAAAREEWD